MIYVSDSHVDQIEYLISQSIQGNHVLFDSEVIRRVLNSSPALSAEDSYGVEHHLERLIQLASLDEKRAYLDRLDRETFERVVKTYLNIVENSLFENLEVRH